MNVQRDTLSLSRGQRVEVDINLSAEIHITAMVAQRRVSRLVTSEIGNLLYGGDPTLVIGERICWRVPILLGYPDVGTVGQGGYETSVGTLDVDVETGEILVTPEKLTQITEYAHHLAKRSAGSESPGLKPRG